MSDQSLNRLRSLAKQLARARAHRLTETLDAVARLIEHEHWPALVANYKKGWRPTPGQIDLVEAALFDTNPLRSGTKDFEWTSIAGISGVVEGTQKPLKPNPLEIHAEGVFYGELDGHQFRLMVILNEAVLEGRGWEITVPEAPGRKTTAAVSDRRIKNNPIYDEEFRSKAVQIAEIRAGHIRAQIASNWPRRSLVPDKKGRVEHPLFNQFSNLWGCEHCGIEISGHEISTSRWFCPKCNASPIDIYAA